MKIAVITDVHGNKEAVQAITEHAAANGVEGYALLGDFVGYGADPGWVVDWARDLANAGAIVVQGNHDFSAVTGISSTMRPGPREAIAWTRDQLDDDQIDFLASLPLVAQRGRALYVHANAWAPGAWGYIFGRAEAKRSLLATFKAVTFCGHMHDPRLYHLSPAGGSVGQAHATPGMPVVLLGPERWLAIPGSAGQPRDGNPAACYLVYDDLIGAVHFHRVAYDHASAAAKIRAAGLPALLADRLALGV